MLREKRAKALRPMGSSQMMRIRTALSPTRGSLSMISVAASKAQRATPKRAGTWWSPARRRGEVCH
jgi:hypothetical protein